MTDRKAPLPPRVMPVIPVVPWSSAPPPLPPRSFSTEPPPPNHPPSEPTLVRHEPIDARAMMMGDPYRAEEVRDEARGLVRLAIEESLAPLHFKLNELQRRLDALEHRGATSPPPLPRAPGVSPAPPPVAPLPAVASPLPGSPPLVVVAQPPRAMSPAAPLPVAPSPLIMAPMAQARVPAEPFDGGAARGALSSRTRVTSPSFDADVPFDGARRKRRIVALFALVFVLLLGGLLASMAMSYSR